MYLKLRRHIVPELNIQFINRELEFEKFLKFENGRIHVISGPKGCGKTEFLKEIVYTFENSKDYYIIFTTYGIEETKLFISSIDLVKELVREIGNVIQEVSQPIGLIIKGFVKLSDLISKLLKFYKIWEKHTIVIIDEFREIYSNDLSRQFLEVESNYVRDLNLKFYEHGGSFKIVVTTSDATITYLRSIVGTKVNWYIMWNFDKETTYRLLNELKCSIDYELIWYLTGGNPREIVNLKNLNWNIHKWIDIKIQEVITCFREYSRIERVSINEILKELSENVDDLSWKRIWIYMLKHNIVIEIDERFEKLNNLPKIESIGKTCAFQLPIYYHIIRTMMLSNNIKLSSEDVLNILKKSS